VGEGILGFFDTAEARDIRLVCTEFRAAVESAPWADVATHVLGNVWTVGARASRAQASISVEEDGMVNLPLRHNEIVDADFAHFEGIYTLIMSNCGQAGVTDATFVHLKGIYTRHVGVRPSGHHGRAFVYLKGIHTLDMTCCSQAGITDAAFVHLEGITRSATHTATRRASQMAHSSTSTRSTLNNAPMCSSRVLRSPALLGTRAENYGRPAHTQLRRLD
jgi:hypothetical protein